MVNTNSEPIPLCQARCSSFSRDCRQKEEIKKEFRSTHTHDLTHNVYLLHVASSKGVANKR